MPLTLPAFTKLTTAEQHQAETFYTKFHPNRSRNVEIEGRNSLSSFSKARLSLSRFSQYSMLIRQFLLLKKNPIPIPKFMISHKTFSCRQRGINGRTCSRLLRKEGLIWQTIFEWYIPTVNTTRLPLPNICLYSNPTHSSFIGGANPAIYFTISGSLVQSL
jgi:hypothetical protein